MSYMINSQEATINKHKKIQGLIKDRKQLISQLLDPDISPSTNTSTPMSSIHIPSSPSIKISSSPNVSIPSSLSRMNRYAQSSSVMSNTVPNITPTTIPMIKLTNNVAETTDNFKNYETNGYTTNNSATKDRNQNHGRSEFFDFNTNSSSSSLVIKQEGKL